VENNDYGLAIAYSTTLIFVMLAVVGAMQLVVGKTEIGRRMSKSRTNV
jgi:iron(III) transport system permease protein